MPPCSRHRNHPHRLHPRPLALKRRPHPLLHRLRILSQSSTARRRQHHPSASAPSLPLRPLLSNLAHQQPQPQLLPNQPERYRIPNSISTELRRKPSRQHPHLPPSLARSHPRRPSLRLQGSDSPCLAMVLRDPPQLRLSSSVAPPLHRRPTTTPRLPQQPNRFSSVHQQQHRQQHQPHSRPHLLPNKPTLQQRSISPHL